MTHIYRQPKWWRDSTGEWVKCETCQHNNAIGVFCVPSIPYSAAYCDECLQANAHPWWLLVANTADIGGLEDAAPWWVSIVKATCHHLGRTLEQFKLEVRQKIESEK